jgi:Icc-related predicted phosphoesterase
MKVALASDIHLEFADCILKNDQDIEVLILAGDIMIAQDLHDHPEPASEFDKALIAKGQGLGRRQQKAQRYRDFLSRCSFQFPHVVYVAGNHEFYNGRWVASIQHLRDECSKYPNIHYLERDTFTLNDVTFVGGTLWTDMNRGDPLTLHSVADMMNDFRIIRNDGLGYTKLRPAHTVLRHRETLDYIKHVVDEHKDRKYVVVGHHAPSSLSIHSAYINQSLMNPAYYSDLSEFILDRPQIKYWVHGHVHTPFDYELGATRVLCNPRGYVGYERDANDEYNLLTFEV